MKNAQAKKYGELTYIEVLNRGLKVMDSTAISLCMDNRLPILVFNLLQRGNIKKAVSGERIGTLCIPAEVSMTDREVLDPRRCKTGDGEDCRRRSSVSSRGLEPARASTALLEGIQAEYYGAKTPLIQLATLSAPEPRLLIVQPFDKAALIGDRKGDPAIRSRPQPDERRQDLAYPDPRAHRGAPQGDRPPSAKGR